MSRPTSDTLEEKLRKRCQDRCKARCCRYITISLPAPRQKADFDEISWFLAHENISVYVEGRRWHVEVRNRCKYLTRQNRCRIYNNRPDVCREYDIESCEYPDRPAHTLHFDTRDEFDAWWARKRARERRRRKRRTHEAKQ